MADLLTNEQFEKFRKTIYDESGITFSATNRSILDSRLKERLRDKKLDSVDDYYKLVISNREEMKVMLDSVTTNLTRFFRNQPHFDALINYVIPHILEDKKKTGNHTVKIWSAGCSTGEEPYTLSMILKDILPPAYDFQIIASDLSLKSLMVGKQGFYPTARIDGIPPKYLNRFFTKTDTGYQANKELMSPIRFDYHNLKNDNGIRNMDIIFCRNVLIYFDEPAQFRVINHFWNALGPHGYLYIGHSESLFGMNTKFKFLRTQWTTLYEKNSE